MMAYTEREQNLRKNLAMRGNACTMIIVVQVPFAWISMEVNKNSANKKSRKITCEKLIRFSKIIKNNKDTHYLSYHIPYYRSKR